MAAPAREPSGNRIRNRHIQSQALVIIKPSFHVHAFPGNSLRGLGAICKRRHADIIASADGSRCHMAPCMWCAPPPVIDSLLEYLKIMLGADSDAQSQASDQP